jgi:hypothetical protein
MKKFSRKARRIMQRERISHAYTADEMKKQTENIIFGQKKDSQNSFLIGFFAGIFLSLMIFLTYYATM